MRDTRHGGSRPGAGRKGNKVGPDRVVTWVPVRNEAEAAAVKDLTPEERHGRLVEPADRLVAVATNGARLALARTAGGIGLVDSDLHQFTADELAAIGPALAALAPDRAGVVDLGRVIAVLEQAGFQVGALIL